jgi:hypothetical protein
MKIICFAVATSLCLAATVAMAEGPTDAQIWLGGQMVHVYGVGVDGRE